MLDSDLCQAADNRRANSNLTASDYFILVLSVTFLGHEADRFGPARKQIEANRARGGDKVCSD